MRKTYFARCYRREESAESIHRARTFSGARTNQSSIAPNRGALLTQNLSCGQTLLVRISDSTDWGRIAIRLEDLSGSDFAKYLSSEWGNLQRRVDSSAPFLHPDYMALWSETLGKQTCPRVIAAWSEGDLVGYAPFMETVDTLGPLSVSTLRFIGNNIGYPGDILYTDIVASEPKEPIVRAILSHVKETCKVAKWDFGYLHPRSSTGHIAKGLLGLGEVDAQFLHSQSYVTLELPPDWDIYMKSLSRNTRKAYRRRLQKLERLGDLRMCVDRDPKTTSQRVSELIRNHEKWWKGTPKEGWFGDVAVHQFLTQAAQLLARQGRYLAFTLELDGTPIGWNVGAFDRGRYFSQISSYNQVYASYSPGMILSFFLIRRLHSMNIHCVEFGPGFNQRKRSLGGQPKRFVQIQGYLGWLRRFARLRNLWARKRVSP